MKKINFKVNEKKIIHDISFVLKKVCVKKKNELHKPKFFGNEKKYLNKCIDTTFVSSVGNYVDQFESQLTQFTGSKHAVAVVNGTSALHIALKLSGVNAGDEVILPAMTFIGTANAVHYLGATPHFVDSNETDLGMDADILHDWLKHTSELTNNGSINKKTGNKISAIIPVHTLGHPCNIEKLLKIAKDFKINLIEDAAESIGSFYKSRHTGTFGKFGIMSFNGNKTITTGGGGVILTNSKNLAIKAKHISSTAKEKNSWNYSHDKIGYNYRMPNINAALGCAQLENIDKILDDKKKLYKKYYKYFKNIKNLKMICEPPNSKSNYWLQGILLNKNMTKYQKKIIEYTNSIGFQTRPIWKLCSSQKPYKNCPRSSLINAKSLEKRIINLPSNITL